MALGWDTFEDGDVGKVDISDCVGKKLGEECEARCAPFWSGAAGVSPQKLVCVASSFDQGVSTLVSGADAQAKLKGYVEFHGPARTPANEYPRFRPKGGTSFLLDCIEAQ